MADLRRELASPDVQTRAYWMGALLREANSRDVWLFISEQDIVDMWPHLTRYLGKARERWGWLLDQFPVVPLPVMLSPLTSEELKVFRDELSERLRRLARNTSAMPPGASFCKRV